MPKNLTEHYRLRLRVLTPVHVGGGEEATIKRHQYFLDDNKSRVNIIDEKKLARVLARKKQLDTFARLVMDGAASLNMANLLDRLKFSAAEKQEITSYSLDLRQSGIYRLNDLRGFIKDVEGRPYIPGSSLKGSFRTALLTAEVIQDPGNYESEREQVMSYLKDLQNGQRERQQGYRERSRRSNLTAASLEQRAFERLQGFKAGPLRSVMRGLKVGDTTPIDKNSLIVAQKKDLLFSDRGNINPVSLYREYLRPGTTCEFSLTLDYYFLDALGIKDLKDIFKRLDTARQWLFEAADSPYVVYQRAGINYNLEMLKKEKKPLVCLGGGVGYLHKTVIYPLGGGFRNMTPGVARLLDQRFRIHRHALKDKIAAPRALKLVEYQRQYYLPGWCVLEEVK